MTNPFELVLRVIWHRSTLVLRLLPSVIVFLCRVFWQRFTVDQRFCCLDAFLRDQFRSLELTFFLSINLSVLLAEINDGIKDLVFILLLFFFDFIA